MKTIITAAVVVLIILAIVLGMWFCFAKWCKARHTGDGFTKGNVKPLNGKGEKPKYNDSLPQTNTQAGKGEAEMETFVLVARPLVLVIYQYEI